MIMPMMIPTNTAISTDSTVIVMFSFVRRDRWHWV